MFDTIKRYNPNDNSFQATEGIIKTIQILILDVKEELDNWEQLFYIQFQDYERFIDKPENTIIMNKAARFLPISAPILVSTSVFTPAIFTPA